MKSLLLVKVNITFTGLNGNEIFISIATVNKLIIKKLTARQKTLLAIKLNILNCIVTLPNKKLGWSLGLRNQ